MIDIDAFIEMRAKHFIMQEQIKTLGATVARLQTTLLVIARLCDANCEETDCAAAIARTTLESFRAE